MEVKIISKTANEVEMEIKGEDHTLMNALKATLLKDKSVKVATYDIVYPGISNPVLFVRTDKSDGPHRCDQERVKEAERRMRRLRKAVHEESKGVNIF